MGNLPHTKGAGSGWQPVDDFAFSTSQEANPWVEIDLGREVSVTGVRVLNRTKVVQPGMDRAATLRLPVSSDGKTWTEVWKVGLADSVLEKNAPGRGLPQGMFRAFGAKMAGVYGNLMPDAHTLNERSA